MYFPPLLRQPVFKAVHEERPSVELDELWRGREAVNLDPPHDGRQNNITPHLPALSCLIQYFRREYLQIDEGLFKHD